MKKLIPILLLFAFTQCHTPKPYSKAELGGIRINKDSLKISDEKTHVLIQSYKVKLDSLMGEVLCFNEQDLSKQLPEGSLGNMLCDELMLYVKDKVEKKIDFCLYNHGGIRIGSLSKGNITVGKIYELAPFDNYLEVVELDGKSCKKLFDLIAQNGGTPCSKELRIKIQNNQASDISINQQAFDENRNYLILTNDYVAAGGDKTEPMKSATNRYKINVFVRDAMIQHLRDKGKSKEALKATVDGRMEIIK